MESSPSMMADIGRERAGWCCRFRDFGFAILDLQFAIEFQIANRKSQIANKHMATNTIIPRCPITVRPAVASDQPFTDSLQKMHSHMVGWMPGKQLEEKIA